MTKRAEWEMVLMDADHTNTRTMRMRVYGGWLIKIENFSQSTTCSNFYPDPEHKWEVE